MSRFFSFLAVSVLVALGWFTYASLTDAFGSGPPYYSGTTNMDKWTNPLPVLIPLNAAGWGAAYWLVRRNRKDKRRADKRRVEMKHLQP